MKKKKRDKNGSDKNGSEGATCPLRATGRSKMPCMPRIALCGGLIIGVPMSEPNTPPLLMVKVPPSMSSMAKSPFFAYPGYEGMNIRGTRV